MSDEEEAEYCHMWDGTEDWGLHKLFIEQTTVTVHLAGQTPSIQEIVALRKLLPEDRYLPPDEVRTAIGNNKTLELPIKQQPEASFLAERGRSLGLNISEEDTSYDYYLPVLRQGDPVVEYDWMMDDEALAQEIVSRMIAAGVPIVKEWK